MSFLTVGQIAERIREPDEEIAAVIQRLRFFTSSGWLKPEGRRQPGTGRKRRYPEHALVDAALLSKLSLLFGMPASKVVLFGNALRQAREAANEFEEQLRDGCLIYLTLGVIRDLKGRPKTLASELQYVRDVDVAADVVGGPSNDDNDDWAQRQILVHKKFDFGFVINLTRMFQNIGLGGGNG